MQCNGRDECEGWYCLSRMAPCTGINHIILHSPEPVYEVKNTIPARATWDLNLQPARQAFWLVTAMDKITRLVGTPRPIFQSSKMSNIESARVVLRLCCHLRTQLPLDLAAIRAASICSNRIMSRNFCLWRFRSES